MQEIFEGLNQLSSAIVALICLPTLVYGILECFFGYKIMKILFAIQGFFLGGILGMAIGCGMMRGQGAGEMVGPALLCGLIVGVLGAYLLYKLYLIGVFCSNASMVFLVGILLGGTGESNLMVWGILGVLVGILAVKFVRICVIAVTGIFGGLCAGTALMGMLGVYETGPALLAGIVLAVLGILHQWKTTDGEFVKTKKRAARQIYAAPAAQEGTAGAPFAFAAAQPVPAACTAPAAIPVAADAAPARRAETKPATDLPWRTVRAPKAPKQAAGQEEMPEFLKKALERMN